MGGLFSPSKVNKLMRLILAGELVLHVVAVLGVGGNRVSGHYFHHYCKAKPSISLS